MDYKERILPLFDKVNEIALRNSTSERMIQTISLLKGETEDFKVFIPLLGTFNAGKSSLLNAFLQKELLPINIVPETSIATELHYGKEEKLVAYKKDGGKDELPLSEIANVSPQQYKYIKIYQSNSALNELNNIVIVDMPGLDSTISEHNQAIINYIKQGVYYIILADVEFGLKESVLSFLYELEAYDIDFSILVSKIDHKLPEDVELVQQNVKTVAKSITGKDITVGTVSTKLGQITDFVDVLKNLDQTHIMRQNLEPKIMDAIYQVQKDLEIRIKHYSIDTTEIDRTIRELERGLADIEREIELQSQQIERKFGGETVESVLRDVEQVLHENIFSLVRAAKSGGEHLNREINQLIRPTLIQSVDFNVTEVFSSSFENISGKMDKLHTSLSLITTNLKEGGQKLSAVVEVISDPRFRTIVGGLALATTVVAPWVELIIFFLPEIIKLFSNQEQQIQQQIEEQVIPEIITKLRPEIKQNLMAIKEQFIEEMRSKVENDKMELVASLRQAKEDKKLAEHEGQQAIETMIASLEDLTAMQQTILKERDIVESVG